MNILIVDDIVENISLLETLFDGAGYGVVSARNGKEALNRLQEKTVELIISDILMPVMDGFQLCRECKTNPEWREISFVFYTATYTEKRDEEFALTLGADQFVVKPQDPERFLKIIKDILDLHQKKAKSVANSLLPEEGIYLSMYNEALVRKLEKKAAELSQVNMALRESEKKYRLVVDNAAEAILVAQDEMICFINPGGARLLGYPEEMLTSKHFWEFIHPEDRAIVLDRYRKRLNGEAVPAVHSFRIVDREETVKWVEINTVIISWNEQPATLNFLTDITHRKQAEEALEESNALIETVVENIPLMIFLKESKDLKFIIFNRAGEELLGYDRKSLLGKNNLDLFPPEQAAQFMAKDREVLDGEAGMLDIPEEPILTAKKGQRLLHTRKVCIRSADGETKYLLGISEDITERKREEKLLRETEEKFRKAFNTSPDAVNINRFKDGLYVSINPGFTKITGYTEADIIGKTSIEFNIWDNIEDRQRLIAGLKKDGEVINLEASFRMKNGDIRFGLMSASIIDLDGVPHIINITRDITIRKQADEALRESENKYRLLADNVNDVIFVLDMNLNYTYVSPSVKVLRGYEPEEVLKQPTSETLTPSSLDLAMRTLSDVIALEKSEHREINISRTLQLEMVRKDGTTLWTEVKFSFIRDEDQQPVGILGLTRDITERKRAEEELEKTVESLKKAVGTTIQVMVSVIEVRDPYTAGHQLRVAGLASAIATEMGLSQETIEAIHMAGPIHDIGKLSIPSEILSKPKKLSELEFSLIKAHSKQGYIILKDVESPWPLAEIVYQHHERMDGSGYPRNLKGDDILMEARILAVADVVESMASHRPYRPSLGIEAALNEIEKNRGIYYDNVVADVCLRLFREKGYKLER